MPEVMLSQAQMRRKQYLAQRPRTALSPRMGQAVPMGQTGILLVPLPQRSINPSVQSWDTNRMNCLLLEVNYKLWMRFIHVFQQQKKLGVSKHSDSALPYFLFVTEDSPPFCIRRHAVCVCNWHNGSSIFTCTVWNIIYFLFFWELLDKGNIHSQTSCHGFLVMESIMLRSLLSIPVAFAESAISNSCLICYLQ